MFVVYVGVNLQTKVIDSKRIGFLLFSIYDKKVKLFYSFFRRIAGYLSMIQVSHKKRMRIEDLSFCHPSLLFCLDQMLAVTELSQHLVTSSKTVKLIIPRGARCMGHVEIMLSAVCSLEPHSHCAEKARALLCMDEPKRPTPVRRR